MKKSNVHPITKFNPLSVEYLTGKSKQQQLADKTTEKNLDAFNSREKFKNTSFNESTASICTLIDSVKTNFLKLENTLQEKIGLAF